MLWAGLRLSGWGRGVEPLEELGVEGDGELGLCLRLGDKRLGALLFAAQLPELRERYFQ